MHKSTLKLKGLSIPLYACRTIIVGSGAAGMNCAVRLLELQRAKGVKSPEDDCLVVTGGLPLGASRMSGSDKQTYYKMGTSPRVPDTAEDFARTLTAFGCCHGDNALAEGIASLRGFYHLVEVGVPFPHDPWGAFIGYKTDHDPYERATSAGPKTSKFMSEGLEAKARHLGLQIIDKQAVVEFLTVGLGAKKRIVGMVAIDKSRASKSDLGLTLFLADNWVLAAGGPGEIYRDTVYPRGQIGIHGPAFKAGLAGANLTESQYGLASTRFRWNVSGTYMQVVPRIFSTDASGKDPREFLAEYFDDMPTMATNIFLKGYQWPFDAQRITDKRSSLVDMAVHQEIVVRGRRVWMDFLKNPVGKPGWAPFRIEDLKAEALDYLQKTGALQKKPIDRLAHMNPPAIDIYSEHGIDLYKEPLEIAVCAQHNNGGFAVNKWWESSIPRAFVVGEMAGTHGVKRPGGSALNSGQVGGIRAAEYIANVYLSGRTNVAAMKSAVKDSLASVVADLRSLLAKGRSASQSPSEAIAAVQERMTRYGAHLRSRHGVERALEESKAQYRLMLDEGLKVLSPKELPAAVAAVQQTLTSVAFLKAIDGLFERGVGSRGSHCILDDSGIEMDPRLINPATGAPYRFKSENEALRAFVLCARYNPNADDLFDLYEEPVRPIPKRDIAFEPAWTEFRDGKIFDL
jgi:succinate dehydrogenase/fumarate reductase flavoprotein subunit